MDSIVQAVIRKFQERSELGQKKYGTTLDRTDLKPLDWIQHAQEELMDGILYLERLKKDLSICTLDNCAHQAALKPVDYQGGASTPRPSHE
jgi:hypothetical protein